MFRDKYEIDFGNASIKEKTEINSYINLTDQCERGIKDFSKLTFISGAFGIGIGCLAVVTKDDQQVYNEIMKICCNLTLFNSVIATCDFALEKGFRNLVFKAASKNSTIKIRKKEM